MSLHVKSQMVGPGEGSLTQFAVERFVPSVFPLMSSELVRPGEPPATVLPLADVGLLPGVGPQVGLQVAGLGVGLTTPGVVAGVAGALPLEDDHHLRSPGAAGLLWLTRGGEGQTRGGGRRHQLQHGRGRAPAGRGARRGGGGGCGGAHPPRDD